MGKFGGKVAIITGGGKGGIGWGLSTAFARKAAICYHGPQREKLEDAKEELERLYGIKVLCLQADGGDEAQVESAVRQTAEEFGRIDFLINNAQNSASGLTLVEHTKEDFDKAIMSACTPRSST
ncbi:MAG: SDR family NAD(P)-dependent oxidoreductase [Eggerthellaceae bacterium]